METNDHDLLIELKTLVKGMAEQQKAFFDRYEVRHTDLSNRVSVLESKDSRDSEKFKGLTDEIRRSLANSTRIEGVQTDVNNLGTKLVALEVKIGNVENSVGDLKKKSNILDTVNAIGVMISGVVGYVFGNK